MDLNLYLYLALFLLLVGLFLFSLVKRRREETRESDRQSAPEPVSVQTGAEDRGRAE